MKIPNLELDNKKILLIAIIGIAFLYFDFSVIISWQMKSLKSLSPCVVKLKVDLDKFSQDWDKMQQLKKKQSEGVNIIPTGAKRLISDEQVVLLLDDISDLAQKDNVQIMQIKQAREAPSKQEAAAKIKLVPLLLNLELVCDYHQLGAFISDLENAKFFIAVQNIKVLVQTANFMKQRAILVLRTYVKK